MPATAGRVRMPANNRVHSSAALQTHGIWQSAIGYDPYAPNKDDAKNSSQPKSSNSEPEAENAYASFQGLLALARITGSNADETRGAYPDAIQASVLSGLDKLKGNVGKKVNGKGAVEDESESEEEDESESSDSDADSEIERIIADRYEKKGSSKRRSSRKEVSDDDGSDSRERKKRGRSKRRSGKRVSGDLDDDDDESRRKRRKEKRKKRNDSSDEEKSSDEDKEGRRLRRRKSRKEKRRRRSHRYSDDSDSSGDSDRHKRKSRRAASLSDSDISGSDDSRVGRGTKRDIPELPLYNNCWTAQFSILLFPVGQHPDVCFPMKSLKGGKKGNLNQQGFSRVEEWHPFIGWDNSGLSSLLTKMMAYSHSFNKVAVADCEAYGYGDSALHWLEHSKNSCCGKRFLVKLKWSIEKGCKDLPIYLHSFSKHGIQICIIQSGLVIEWPLKNILALWLHLIIRGIICLRLISNEEIPVVAPIVLHWGKKRLLIWCCCPLVELCKSHTHTHRMLQELLSTSPDAGLFLLVKGFAPEALHTVTKTFSPPVNYTF
ncbi:CAX-interacting protein 4 [Vitis vinifera]|uniref:CAX-interacting protein 4 n=1 Tax=Vitis vinifera TaxID=29760 RepID=A0A438FAY6_VITVI|nr:CAX-interacting protein 4 [Vitis vinifera]